MNARRGAADHRLSDLLLTDVDLARQARTVLAAATGAVVVFGLPGTSLIHPQRVTVHDHDGEARIGCEPGGIVERAATARRFVVLRVDPVSESSARLRLGGRLLRAPGGDHSEPGPTGAGVWLSVDRVEVLCPHLPGLRSHQGRQVPVELYAAARPDPFLVGLHRLVEHTNRHHGLDLRRVAAYSAGVALGQVGGAAIRHLDRCGLGLSWIGASGAHELSLDFARPADSLQDLIATLQAYFRTATRLL